jgi:hypothetical protein
VTGAAVALVWSIAAALSSPSSADAAVLARDKLPGLKMEAHCKASEGTFAVAVRDTSTGGKYFILSADRTPTLLGSFSGEPELNCLSAESARDLSSVIQASETIHGKILPQSEAAVVCGFLSATEARCWQFEQEGALREIGGWVT